MPTRWPGVHVINGVGVDRDVQQCRLQPDSALVQDFLYSLNTLAVECHGSGRVQLHELDSTSELTRNLDGDEVRETAEGMIATSSPRCRGIGTVRAYY